MADGQVRRTLRRKRNVAANSGETTRVTDGSTASESAASAGHAETTDRDDSNTVAESNSTQRNGIGIIEVDPNELDSFIARDAAGSGRDGDGNGDGSSTRKRRTYTRRTRSKEAPANIEAVASMLHTLAATVLHTPELILSPEECKQLSDAYASFSEHHEVPLLTAKRMSEIQLVSTAFMIYGTRLVAIRNRKRNESVARNSGGKVVDMPSHANAQHAQPNVM